MFPNPFNLDGIAAQRQLTPIERQLICLENQNRKLIKMISDTHICQPPQIIVCAGCGKKLDKLYSNSRSRKIDAPQTIVKEGLYVGSF